jgi:exopolyphosphatase/guanosine-5'-triphosphate,3'-diphosphate pyrophosphatase
LGAGRLTRELEGDPPGGGELKELRRSVRAQVAEVRREIRKVGVPDRVVGSSKTIRALGRICGAAPSGEGPYVRRTLRRSDLAEVVPRLGSMSAAQRRELPGVSQARSAQVLAGAIVVESVMELFDVEELVICPWALREGVILRRLDWLSQ